MTDNFIDWEEVRSVWESGIGTLEDVCTKYHIPMAEVMLRAKQENWRDRNAGLFAGTPLNIVFEKDLLTGDQVTLAHKTDLGNLRLIANVILKQLQFASDHKEVLSILDKLANIYTKVIPVERKVFGLESEGDDGSPDNIHFHMHTPKG